ncbi:Protein fluG [Hypsizygus marmoreus]|uniref:Protein fluG n=1 Tax=Hypsizygus marmoreus TaxID=39966 RepID=A0A369JGB0_HYPMA|nr:Protein fluG [Hypsizygus marmoreus]
MRSISYPPEPTDLPKLHSAAFTFPAIDNHAHALLRIDNRDSMPFEGLISEAAGDALTKDSVHTLACYRATHQLAELLGLPAGSSWDDVKVKRSELAYLDLCKLCFEPVNIQCILIDDGLGARDIVYDIPWHDHFTRSQSWRVVRIEAVAEEVLEILFKPFDSAPADNLDLVKLLALFVNSLTGKLTTSATDTQVVAYKSVVCYRTGLAVSATSYNNGGDPELLDSFKRVYETYRLHGKLRVEDKALNDYVVCTALDIGGRFGKPVQFHTGLGDNDIDLVLSSPAYLQSIIKTYPDTTFILLHSSYPYTREAGYLTSVYSNVYLDFGEIFPFVSGQGQRSIIRQILELAPTNKILWSTDGHFWPESYYLGTIQARQALYEVLSENVRSQELTEAEAVTIVENALFYNANRAYKLGLKPVQR